MLFILSYNRIAIPYVVIALVLGIAADSTITPAPPQPFPTAARVISNGTCESRTINYITHSLPSVCLRNGRAGTFTDTRIDEEINGGAAPTRQEAQGSATGQPMTTTMKQAISLSITTEPAAESQTLAEEDSEVLDDASFLSFEEWKKQTQEKAEQDVDKKRKDGTHETLESAGEDGVIDMDIHAIIGQRQGTSPPSKLRREDNHGKTESQELKETGMPTEKPRYRSKDAGKTCKERFNFASVDAGGQVMKANPEATSTSALLKENRDVYMLNVCQAKNKFIIVELSDSIYVETIALANFEFFSSTFRHFRVSVSAKYPVKIDKWVTLGTFEAHNSRDIQAFLIENPMIEARYLRVEFLSFYGNEFYCPVSLLRVHGQTMLQEVMSWERAASGEEDEDESEEPESVDAENHLTEVEVNNNSDGQRVVESLAQAHTAVDDLFKTAESLAGGQIEDYLKLSQDLTAIHSSNHANMTHTMSAYTPKRCLELLFARAASSADATCAATQIITAPPTSASASNMTQSSSWNSSITTEAIPSDLQPTTFGPSKAPQAPITATDIKAPFPSNLKIESHTDGVLSSKDSATSTSSRAANATHAQEATIPTQKSSTSAISHSSSTKPSKTSVAHATQPTTQESFFKTVTKRLQLLEANSTLSLKYIEEQSRILREAFTKVEKRQLAKTTLFLENLNNTVLAELRKFGQDYDQIWQSTVIELETQREQFKRETAAVTARLSILGDELVFQKRMSIVQSVLLLLCLAIVVFSRGFGGNLMDVPAIQNMLAKSTSPSRWGYDSLSESPSVRRKSSARDERHWRPGHMHRRSDDSIASRSRENSPATPFSAYLRPEDEQKEYSVQDGTQRSGFSETSFDESPTKYEWNHGHDTSEDAFRPSTPSIVDSPPRRRHIRQREGTITQNMPRIDIQEFEDESSLPARDHQDNLVLNLIAGRIGSKQIDEIGRAYPNSHLASPPSDTERGEFTIARKPLPALPTEI